jgi:hypothetical protein
VTVVEYRSLVADLPLAVFGHLGVQGEVHGGPVLPSQHGRVETSVVAHIKCAYYCFIHSRPYEQRQCRLSTRQQTGLYVSGLPSARSKGLNRQYCGYTESLPGRARLRRSVLRCPLAYMSESRVETLGNTITNLIQTIEAIVSHYCREDAGAPPGGKSEASVISGFSTHQCCLLELRAL